MITINLSYGLHVCTTIIILYQNIITEATVIYKNYYCCLLFLSDNSSFSEIGPITRLLSRRTISCLKREWEAH